MRGGPSVCRGGGCESCEFPCHVSVTLSPRKRVEGRVPSYFCSYNPVYWGSAVQTECVVCYHPLFRVQILSLPSPSQSSGLRGSHEKGYALTAKAVKGAAPPRNRWGKKGNSQRRASQESTLYENLSFTNLWYFSLVVERV